MPQTHVKALTAVWLILLASFATQCARSQGILYPRPDVSTQPFYVKNLRVNTKITDAVAETSVEQTFVNNSSAPQEGTYLFPLPVGAMPTAFSMTVGDRVMEPRILSKDEARGIYETIVRQRRDPALLEYVGRDLVRVSVFPIPAHGERIIKLRYAEILKPENGLRKYAFPLSTSRFGQRPVGQARVAMEIRSSLPLKNIYSPTHDVSIRRDGERAASAVWEGVNDASDRDLTLYYATSGEDVGLSLLAYKSGDRDGYFMLLAAPRVTVPKSRILPKQIIFVLDRTGSMSGEKIKQARKSLLYCLDSLRPQDRFNVITFNESPDAWSRTLRPATEDNVANARHYVEAIEASGGTNIDEALHAALTLLKSEEGAQKMVVFLTDGLPTVGETDTNVILQHVRSFTDAHANVESANAAHTEGVRSVSDLTRRDPRRPPTTFPARIFCFGLGYDVNVPFLDKLANLGRGDADFVKPEEDIEAKVSAFFAKVASPILANVRLAFDGADVYDVYPKTLPDLFTGAQLVITGRFRGEGGGTVGLAGSEASGALATYRQSARFAQADSRNDFLPRIWATRKIGYLIDQVRLSENPQGQKEIIDEIVRLSRDYGVITEYTSFLVDEREQTALNLLTDANSANNFAYGAGNATILREEIARRAGRNGVAGPGATDQSLRAKDLFRNDKAVSRYQSAAGGVNTQADLSLQTAPSAARGNFGAGGTGGGRADWSLAAGAPPAGSRVTVQAVGDRVFYRQANHVWQDNAYDGKKQTLYKVQAYSDAHFALLKALPALAAYSSVGEDVIIRLGSAAVQIGKTGRDKLTALEVKRIVGGQGG